MSPKVPDIYKQHKKIEILQAAEQVFIRKGFGRVTMKDIVEQCQISRGGVYLYFSSTDEIFQAILDWKNGQPQQELLLIYESANNGEEALTQFIILISTYMKETANSLYRAHVEFFSALAQDDNRWQFVQQRHELLVNNYAFFFQEGTRLGYFSPQTDLRILTKFVLTWCEGFSLNTMILPMDDLQADTQIELLHQYLRQMLRIPSF
ncbi:TetR/AcrR family transcriptional regulator [Paenibacillus sp. N1-5-1-14]|uniref:TetR/AcrR family transcriptional regulator n=1 Tax=Paenibacillus radicibacter TaxID=2972488 RepID=UPI0021597E18|nr:TetR/AcrR family transcriptional regulator [Paenibacillus radicibacter]MCR8642469.1 TetR/AcrR family transcriptional regulator [Paenibacillus radicibacter]